MLVLVVARMQKEAAQMLLVTPYPQGGVVPMAILHYWSNLV